MKKHVLLPLLYDAASNGDIESLMELQRAGAHYNMENANGTTALHIADYCNHVMVVDYLLKNGADVDKVDKHDISTLQHAVSKNHHQLIEILVENGAYLPHAIKKLEKNMKK